MELRIKKSKNLKKKQRQKVCLKTGRVFVLGSKPSTIVGVKESQRSYKNLKTNKKAKKV